jgi:uncharacterized protein (TIGR03000 family)
MNRRCLWILPLLVLMLLPVVLDRGGSAAHAGQGGHGGGAGHTGIGPVGQGFGPHGGWYGGYGRGCWGYPGWCGVGLGLGLGCGLAYGYPYDDYYGYPLYGPPYPYPVPYPVVVQGTAPPPGGACAGPPPAQLGDSDVFLNVRVPPEATVWINGVKATQTGPHREFVSSGLVPGSSYTFTVLARWTGPDGQMVELQRRIPVQGGERRTVDFTQPATAPTEAPVMDRATH